MHPTLVLVLLATLGGCAMPVREPPLQGLAPVTALQWRNFMDEKLRGQVSLGEVKGSDAEAEGWLRATLDRVWGSRALRKPVADALEEQLDQLRLLANAAQGGRYVLDVEILSLEAGGLPFGSEGEAELRYRLREAGEGGRLLFEKRLRSAGDLMPGLLWPPARQRAAKESALRANLLRLGGELARLRV